MKVKVNATPVIDGLSGEYEFADNKLQDAFRMTGFVRLLAAHRISKRSGPPVVRVMYGILIWPILGVGTVACFCGEFLGCFIDGCKDVVYDFLKRENINWRGLSMGVSRNVFSNGIPGDPEHSAFVVDDTNKHRRGRKMEGISSQFDHTEGRHVMAHLLVELGIAGPKGFLPVTRQLSVGEKHRRGLSRPFADGRSPVARDWRNATGKNKNQLFRQMIRAALRAGFYALHVVADAWYGTKENISEVIDLGLVAIMAMKRGKLKYRFQGRLYTATMLYNLVRRRMKARRGQRFLTTSLIVEINLETDAAKPERWYSVKLVFSKPRKCEPKTWTLLLCSDTQYSIERILHVYALRWGIEVYFKEAKQHLGLLKEQSTRYAVHYASVHLTAIRYTMFLAVLEKEGGLTFATVRGRAADTLRKLTFAVGLWELFKTLIFGVLDEFAGQLGNLVTSIKVKIDSEVTRWLQKALQCDDESVAGQLAAEAAGVLT